MTTRDSFSELADGDVMADGWFDECYNVMPPVGAVVPWLKSYTNTPSTLSEFWAECNGQTLNDPDSPYDGQTLPDLNGSGGTQRFLRGSTSSGTTGGEDEHTLTVDEMPSHSHNIYGDQSSSHTTTVSYKADDANAKPTDETGGDEPHNNLPSYYEVVFIMRVK